MYSAFLNFSEAIEKNDDLQTSSTFLLHAESILTVHHLKQGRSRIFSRVGAHFQKIFENLTFFLGQPNCFFFRALLKH